jgi:hypothetical protein
MNWTFLGRNSEEIPPPETPPPHDEITQNLKDADEVLEYERKDSISEPIAGTPEPTKECQQEPQQELNNKRVHFDPMIEPVIPQLDMTRDPESLQQQNESGESGGSQNDPEDQDQGLDDEFTELFIILRQCKELNRRILEDLRYIYKITKRALFFSLILTIGNLYSMCCKNN